ncbi:MAG: hypothetical protein K8T10_02325 [Candidatus Eremiobacteraeota bacterium]|nr:hypothetical protein [Candidatus Eremiobacteraeota bacterium]
MTGISASSINTQQREMSNTSPITRKTEKDQSNEIKDMVDIKSGLNKAAKYTLGAATAVIVAPLKAVSRGLNGAVKSGLKGAGFEDDRLPDSTGSKLEWVTIGLAAPIGGAILGMSLGVPGMLLGAVVAPGMAGGLIETGKGAVEGFVEGCKFSGELANKVDEKVSDKLGRVAGIAAGIATAASAVVMGPACAVIGSINRGIGFAEKAIGARDKSGHMEPTLGNFAKDATVFSSYIVGAAKTPGILMGIAAGAATAGGVATTVSAVSEGAKGFVDGVKDSMKFAEFMVG